MASRLLEALNAAAGSLFRAGLLSSRRAAVPVVSVGNIAMGGTGKTPLVIALSRLLADRGRRPAVLTRGYRRVTTGEIVLLGDPDGGWESVGDEPALMARTLPDVPIVIDRDRLAGAATAVDRCGAAVLVLDDGFQHWRLARDADIVVVPAADPLSALTPRRESPRALARATAIAVSGATEATLAAARDTLRRFAPDTTVIGLETVPVAVHSGGSTSPPTTLSGQRVVAAAAIANPERFFAALAALGAEVVDTISRRDHDPWPSEALAEALRRADRLDARLVLTGKDAVKVPRSALADLDWLEIDVEPLGGSFEELLRPVTLLPSGGQARIRP